MIGRTPLLELSETHTRALTHLIELVPPGELPWILTGSANLRLQGVDIPVHDLDIQTDDRTVYLIEQRLGEFMQTAVHYWESPGMKSLDGKAELEGIQIELLANMAHKMPDGSWSLFTDFSRRICMDLHGRQVAVFPLEDELSAYEAMGRTEKTALIRKAIASLPNS